MKKLVFTALAAVFMLSSGFSEGKLVNQDPEQICSWTIYATILNSSTYEIETQNRTFYSYGTSDRDCDNQAQAHLWALQLGVTPW